MRRLSLPRLCRAVSWLCLAGALALAVGMFPSGKGEARDAAEVLTVDHQSRSLPPIRKGEVVAATFVVANHSYRTVHLLGQVPSCFRNVCLAARGVPCAIPPRSQREVSLEVKATHAGGFSERLALFAHLDGVQTFPLHVSGVVAED